MKFRLMSEENKPRVGKSYWVFKPGIHEGMAKVLSFHPKTSGLVCDVWSVETIHGPHKMRLDRFRDFKKKRV